MTEQELIDQMNKNDHAFQQQGGAVPSEEEKLIKQMHQNDPGLGQYDPKKYGILYNQGGQGMSSLNNLGAVPSTMPAPPAPANWSDIWGNIGPSVTKLGMGIAHAARHPLDTIAELSGMAGGEASLIGKATFDSLPPESQDAIRKGGLKAIGTFTPQIQQMILQGSPKLWETLQNEGTKVNNFYGDRYGGLDNIRNTFITDPAGFWADAGAIAAPAVGMGGRLGALAELANPVTTAGRVGGWLAERTGVADAARTIGGRVADTVIPSWVNQDGGVNRVIPSRVIPSVEQAAQNSLLNRATENNVRGVRNALADSQQPGTPPMMDGYPMTQGQFVPNTNPPAGQIIAGSNVPGSAAPPRSFARMQMDANKNNATIADAQSLDNNAAMLDHLQPIGRDPAENRAAFGSPVTDPAAAETLHNSLATSEYGIANGIISREDPALRSLLGRPLTGNAETNAARTAGEVPEDFWIGPRGPAVPAHSVPSGLVDPMGRPIMTNVPAQPAQYGQITGQNLQRMKEEMDALIYGKGDASAPEMTASRREEMLNTRNALVGWINRNNTPWQTARTNYGNRANIIDRMLMGDSLRDTLTNPLMGEDSATLNATSFGNALRESPAKTSSVVSKTKGKARGEHLDDYLTPDEMGRVNNVADDLGRTKMMEQQGKSGSRFSNALNTAGSDFVGGRILGKLPFGDAVTDFVMHGANNNIANRVGMAMFDPTEIEQLLSQTLGRQDELTTMRNRLMGLHRNYLGSLNNYPGVYNALSNDQDK